MMCNACTKMDNKIVKYLVANGRMPAFKDSDSDKIQEAEEKLRKKLRRAQTGLESAFIQELKDQGKLPSSDEERTELINKIMDKDMDSIREAIADENVSGAEIGRQITMEQAIQQGIDIETSEFSQEVLDDFYDKAYEFSQETIDNIKGDFKGTLQGAYEDGIGIDDAAERLEADFESLRKSRLETIARTEIQSSQNKGGNQTMRDIGVEYKQWITADDERVRGLEPEDEFDHISLHSEVVKFDEAFSNGLMHPGDPNGEASNVINCRCTMRPYIPKENENISSTPYYP